MEDSVLELNQYAVTKQKKLVKYLYLKRIFDFTFASIALILLLPLFLIIGLIIKLKDNGPIFYKHKRIGKNNKEFYVYKFRTMVPNADQLLNSLNEEQLKEFRENFKLENDFRITSIGHFLRKTSLDELPQLINIIKGDMSLIGPRPVVKDELEKYGLLQKHLLSITPGLTGWWAANGRSNTTYDERIYLELYYVYHCSLKLDIICFFKTIKTLLKKEGAK